VQDAFAILVWVVAGVGVLVALVTLAGTARGYRDIGGSGLTRDSDGGPAEPGSASDAERDEEIRQMLDARNARRERRGEPPVDVDAELAALARPATDDAALREEVRQLVVARNHRRVRAGKAPLDVEAEVERRIRELN
jgi:hypothetical protein